MRVMRLLLATGLLLVASGSFGQVGLGSLFKLTPKPVSTERAAACRTVWQSKLARICQMAAKGSKEAQELAQQLKTNVVLAVPEFDPSICYVDKLRDSQKDILVVVVTEADRTLSFGWDDRVESHLGAIAFPIQQDSYALSLLAGRDSLWDDILSLTYVKWCAERRRIGQVDDVDKICEAERAATQFQCDLMYALGGEDYRAALKNEQDRIEGVIKTIGSSFSGNDKGIFVEKPDQYDRRLESFGPSSTYTDRRIRSYLLWIAAYFSLNTRYFEKDAVRRNASILPYMKPLLAHELQQIAMKKARQP